MTEFKTRPRAGCLTIGLPVSCAANVAGRRSTDAILAQGHEVRICRTMPWLSVTPQEISPLLALPIGRRITAIAALALNASSWIVLAAANNELYATVVPTTSTTAIEVDKPVLVLRDRIVRIHARNNISSEADSAEFALVTALNTAHVVGMNITDDLEIQDVTMSSSITCKRSIGVVYCADIVVDALFGICQGFLVVSGTFGGEIVVWDGLTGDVVASLPAHSATHGVVMDVTARVFVKTDEERPESWLVVASGSDDRSATVWMAPWNGPEQANSMELSLCGSTLRSHAARVWGVALGNSRDPSQAVLAVACEDGVPSVFNIDLKPESQLERSNRNWGKLHGDRGTRCCLIVGDLTEEDAAEEEEQLGSYLGGAQLLACGVDSRVDVIQLENPLSQEEDGVVFSQGSGSASKLRCVCTQLVQRPEKRVVEHVEVAFVTEAGVLFHRTGYILGGNVCSHQAKCDWQADLATMLPAEIAKPVATTAAMWRSKTGNKSVVVVGTNGGDLLAVSQEGEGCVSCHAAAFAPGKASKVHLIRVVSDAAGEGAWVVVVSPAGDIVVWRLTVREAKMTLHRVGGVLLNTFVAVLDALLEDTEVPRIAVVAVNKTRKCFAFNMALVETDAASLLVPCPSSDARTVQGLGSGAIDAVLCKGELQAEVISTSGEVVSVSFRKTGDKEESSGDDPPVEWLTVKPAAQLGSWLPWDTRTILADDREVGTPYTSATCALSVSGTVAELRDPRDGTLLDRVEGIRAPRLLAGACWSSNHANMRLAVLATSTDGTSVTTQLLASSFGSARVLQAPVHGKDVNAVTIGADPSMLFLGCEDTSVSVWSGRPPLVLGRLATLRAHQSNVLGTIQLHLTCKYTNFQAICCVGAHESISVWRRTGPQEWSIMAGTAASKTGDVDAVPRFLCVAQLFTKELEAAAALEGADDFSLSSLMAVGTSAGRILVWSAHGTISNNVDLMKPHGGYQNAIPSPILSIDACEDLVVAGDSRGNLHVLRAIWGGKQLELQLLAVHALAPHTAINSVAFRCGTIAIAKLPSVLVVGCDAGDVHVLRVDATADDAVIVPLAPVTTFDTSIRSVRCLHLRKSSVFVAAQEDGSCFNYATLRLDANGAVGDTQDSPLRFERQPVDVMCAKAMDCVVKDGGQGIVMALIGGQGAQILQVSS